MNTSYPLRIAGMGRYLPERVVTNAELEALCGLAEGALDRSAAGVVTRRWVAPGETNSTMGARAAREAVASAGLELGEIDLILNASGTQEQAIPDGAALMQRELGMSGTPTLSVHSTCLGFLRALDVAGAFLATGRYKKILIINADIASVGLNFNEPTSAPLFGDAAAACVVVPAAPDEASCIEVARFETFGEGAALTEIRGGGTKHSPNDPATQPEDNLFHMNPRGVFMMAARRFPTFLEGVAPGLAARGADGVDWIVPHQASMKAIRVLEQVGVPSEKIVVTLDRLGNCVSSSLPCSLYEIVADGRLERGQRALLVGTGAGLSLGAVMLRY